MNLYLKRTIAVALVGIAAAQHAHGAVKHESKREFFTLNAKATKDDYVVSISLPEGYLASSEAYPLLVVLDGEYAFNAVADISDYMQRDGAVRPYIVVGVSYGVGFGAPLAAKRSRDFTPPIDQQGVVAKIPGGYYALLKRELLPAISERYRIQTDDITLWTYSLSGTFATWLNYYDRQLFKNYIIASPNLGYGILEKLMAGKIFDADNAVPKKVFMSMDPSEVEDPQNYFKPNAPEITEPLRELIGKFKGYEFRFYVTKGESHATSWLVALPSSLRFIFGKKEPNQTSEPTAPSGRGSP